MGTRISCALIPTVDVSHVIECLIQVDGWVVCEIEPSNVPGFTPFDTEEPTPSESMVLILEGRSSSEIEEALKELQWAPNFGLAKAASRHGGRAIYVDYSDTLCSSTFLEFRDGELVFGTSYGVGGSEVYFRIKSGVVTAELRAIDDDFDYGEPLLAGARLLFGEQTELATVAGDGFLDLLGASETGISRDVVPTDPEPRSSYTEEDVRRWRAGRNGDIRYGWCLEDERAKKPDFGRGMASWIARGYTEKGLAELAAKEYGRARTCFSQAAIAWRKVLERAATGELLAEDVLDDLESRTYARPFLLALLGSWTDEPLSGLLRAYEAVVPRVTEMLKQTRGSAKRSGESRLDAILLRHEVGLAHGHALVGDRSQALRLVEKARSSAFRASADAEFLHAVLMKDLSAIDAALQPLIRRWQEYVYEHRLEHKPEGVCDLASAGRFMLAEIVLDRPLLPDDPALPPKEFFLASFAPVSEVAE